MLPSTADRGRRTIQPSNRMRTGRVVLLLCLVLFTVLIVSQRNQVAYFRSGSYDTPPSLLPSAALALLEPELAAAVQNFTSKVLVERYPRVKISEDFLTPQECEHIISLALPKFARSQVAAGKDGTSKKDNVRTSEGMWLDRDDADPIIAKLTHRISVFSGLPRSHGESLQVLKYEIGQEYKPHPDYFDPRVYGDAFGLKDKGQRAATSITYLNTVPKGGGTEFPKISVTVDAVQGRSLLFRNTDEETGEIDPMSYHAGMPVLEGQKFVIVQWLREKPW